MATLHLDVLQDVRIASPCTASWDDMLGDEKVRHCTLCGLNVHNLSAMSRSEAEQFVVAREAAGSRTCVRFYERPDGTILTQDCPRGLAKARAKLARTAARAAAVFGLAGVAAAMGGSGSRGGAVVRSTAPVRWLRAQLNPPPPTIMGKMACRMGDFAAPPPAQAAPAAGGAKP